MPTYEYKCEACGNEWEVFQSMSAEPIKKCPRCGKNKARRLIGTGAGLIFKGSGFYITDYRDKGYTDKVKAESGESKPAAEAKSSTDTASKPAESKPAAKADMPAAKAESKPAGSKSSKSGKK